MHRQCQIVLGLTLASLLLAGCVSVRHDEAMLPPVRQDSLPATISEPQLLPPRKIPQPQSAPQEAMEPESLPSPVRPLKQDTESTPTPAQVDPPLSNQPTPARPLAKSTLSCGGTSAGCPERPMFVWDLHHRLGGWLHWQRRPPAVPTVIPPRPKFHPVPTHPVFAQQATFTMEAPQQIPSTIGKPLPPPVLESSDEPAPMPLPSPTSTPTPVPPPLDVQPESSDREAEVPRTINNEFRIASPIPLSKPSEPFDDSWRTESTIPR